MPQLNMPVFICWLPMGGLTLSWNGCGMCWGDVVKNIFFISNEGNLLFTESTLQNRGLLDVYGRDSGLRNRAHHT